MSEELKPCPFCGSKVRQYYPINQHDDTKFYCCSNDDCIESVLTKELWNTRPLEDTLRKQLEIAVEALEVYAVKESYQGVAKNEWKLAADALAEIEKIGEKNE